MLVASRVVLTFSPCVRGFVCVPVQVFSVSDRYRMDDESKDELLTVFLSLDAELDVVIIFDSLRSIIDVLALDVRLRNTDTNQSSFIRLV